MKCMRVGNGGYNIRFEIDFDVAFPLATEESSDVRFLDLFLHGGLLNENSSAVSLREPDDALYQRR